MSLKLFPPSLTIELTTTDKLSTPATATEQRSALNLAHLNLINGDIYHLIFNLQNG